MLQTSPHFWCDSIRLPEAVKECVHTVCSKPVFLYGPSNVGSCPMCPWPTVITRNISAAPVSGILAMWTTAATLERVKWSKLV